MHKVEGVPYELSGAVVGDEKMSRATAWLSRSSRDTLMASSLVVESMVRAYTSWERLMGVRRG